MRAVLQEARPKVLVVPKRFRNFGYAGLAAKIRRDVPSLEHVLVARGSAPGAIELDWLLDRPAPVVPQQRPPAPAPAPARTRNPWYTEPAVLGTILVLVLVVVLFVVLIIVAAS